MRPDLSLPEAVAAFVRDGDLVAIEGSSHLVPYAAAHELIRQGRRDLKIACRAPDILLDQLVGMGCVDRLVFAWGKPSGLRPLHRLRDSLERGWPRGLVTEHLRPTDMACAYEAGAMNLPFAVLRGHGEAALPHGERIRSLTCPFTGTRCAAIGAIRPDVALIHAQEADRFGNVLLWGPLGMQRAAAFAARRLIVTVEDIVDDLRAWPNACRLPHAVVSAVCRVRGGAHPSPVPGHYERDQGFYRAWDPISRCRDRFLAWMERHILATPDFAVFRRTLGAATRRSWR